MLHVNRQRLTDWLCSLTYERSTKGRYRGYRWVLNGIALDIVDGKGKDLHTYNFSITDRNGKTKEHQLTYERWFIKQRNIDSVYLATIIIEHTLKTT